MQLCQQLLCPVAWLSFRWPVSWLLIRTIIMLVG